MNKYENEIRDLYIEQGKTIKEVADILNISADSVYYYMKKWGIQRREPHQGFKGHKHKPETKKIISEKLKGRSYTDETKKKMSESTKKGGIGHKKKRSDGYIKIYFPDHPKATKDGYIMEHVLVMECLLGRHLKENECVHHIDHDRQNNKKENLQLMTKSEHMSYHAELRWKNKKGGMTYK